MRIITEKKGQALSKTKKKQGKSYSIKLCSVQASVSFKNTIAAGADLHEEKCLPPPVVCILYQNIYDLIV